MKEKTKKKNSKKELKFTEEEISSIMYEGGICDEEGENETFTVLDLPVFRELQVRINEFVKLPVSDYMEEIPNKWSVSYSLDILNIFKGEGTPPSKISPLLEGGVLFEFFTNAGYHSISIYNDGEIIYLTRPNTGEPEMISSLSASDTKDKLNNAIGSRRE
jgi:hypothetical protein